MESSSRESGAAGLAVTRALGYTLLAHAFAYPDDAGAAALREIAALGAPGLASTPLAELCLRAVEASPEELEAAYVNVFTVGYSPDCPTFETAYLAADLIQQTNRMADIAGFYRAFGVENASGGFRPDDLCVELEFMAFLCQKQAYAAEHLSAARVAEAKRAQRLFLREHLGRWGGGVGARVSACAERGSFYDIAGRALGAWIADDARLIKTGQIQPVDAPAQAWERPNESDDDIAGAQVIELDEIATEVGTL
ncbi:MAG: molecular chaperone TorD family protein [Chloroflexi bacterium]|nr:molecular chaperone TorD family protein [Chloroflexota bacterium]